jgi:hypothetical protein
MSSYNRVSPYQEDIVTAPFDGSIAVNVGDLMFLDADDVKPASSLTWDTDEATTQRAFGPRFVGIAHQSRLAIDATAVAQFPVVRDIIIEMDCESGTYALGDLVAPAENGDSDGLENQKLTKTTDPAAAIGRVVQQYDAPTTRIKVRLTSNVTPNDVHTPNPSFSVSVAAADGTTQAITIQSSRSGVQVFDCYFATDADGATPSTSGAGTGVTATTGEVLKAHTSKLHLQVVTDDTGKAVLSVNNSGGGSAYTDRLVVVNPDGSVTVGDALATPSS